MNKISSIFGGIAVIAVAIVFIVSFQPGGGQDQFKAGPACAATVLGNCVRGTHFTAAFRIVVPRGANEAAVKQLRLKEKVMDGLVERELLVNDAKRLGIGVTDDEISKELFAGRIRASLPASQMEAMGAQLGLHQGSVRFFAFLDRKTKKFSAEAYRRDITETTRLSETDFREFQKEEIIADRVREAIRARVHVGEVEVRSQFERDKSTATVRYVRIEKQFVAAKLLDQSDEAIKAWTEKHKEEVDKAFEGRKTRYATECRNARHILIKVDALGATADEDKKKAKDRLLEAKKKIEEGEDFAKVAMVLSEDGSAKEGGSLGCVLKGQMVKPFEDALFALAKDGDMSDVVESQFGVHLIKVDKIAKGPEAEKAGYVATAKDVYLGLETERITAEGAKEILAAAKGGKSLEDALQAWLDKVMPKKEEPKKEGAAPTDGEPKKDEPKKDEPKKVDPEDELIPTVETSLPFNERGEPFEGMSPDQNGAGIAFGLKKAGDLPNDVVPLLNGYAVMQLKSKDVASEEAWKENRDFYVSKTRTAKQRDALIAYVKRLRATAQAEIKINQEFLADPGEKPKPSAGAPNGEAPPTDTGAPGAPPGELPQPE